jgi:hypothetical protein
MAMVAEGALEEDPKNRAASGIADTFTAIVEGKDGIKSVRIYTFTRVACALSFTMTIDSLCL